VYINCFAEREPSVARVRLPQCVSPHSEITRRESFIVKMHETLDLSRPHKIAVTRVLRKIMFLMPKLTPLTVEP
jgi:hypothetical protein